MFFGFCRVRQPYKMSQPWPALARMRPLRGNDWSRRGGLPFSVDFRLISRIFRTDQLIICEFQLMFSIFLADAPCRRLLLFNFGRVPRWVNFKSYFDFTALQPVGTVPGPFRATGTKFTGQKYGFLLKVATTVS